MAPTETYEDEADRSGSNSRNSRNSGNEVVDLTKDTGGVIDLTLSDSSDEETKTSKTKQTTGNNRFVTPQDGKQRRQRKRNNTSSSEEEIFEISSDSENYNDRWVVAPRLKSAKTRTPSPPGFKPPPEEPIIRPCGLQAAICTKSPPQHLQKQYHAATSLRPRALKYEETTMASPPRMDQHSIQAPTTPSQSAPTPGSAVCNGYNTPEQTTPTVPQATSTASVAPSPAASINNTPRENAGPQANQTPILRSPGLPASPDPSAQTPPQQQGSQAHANDSAFNEYDEEWFSDNFEPLYNDVTRSPPFWQNFSPYTTHFWAHIGNSQWLRFCCARIEQKCLVCMQTIRLGDPIVHYYLKDPHANVTKPDVLTWHHVKCASKAWQNIYQIGVRTLAMVGRIGNVLGRPYTIATNYRQVLLNCIHFTIHPRFVLTIRS